MTIKYLSSFALGSALVFTPGAANAGSRSTSAIPSQVEHRDSRESRGPSNALRGLLRGYEHANEHGRHGIEHGAFEHHFKSRGSC